MKPAYNAAYDVAAAEFAADAESPAADAAWCPEAIEAMEAATEALGPSADIAAEAFGPSAADIAAAAAAAEEPPGDIAARVIMSLYCCRAAISAAAPPG